MISARKNKRKVLAVIMDGVGVREQTYGNAVALAATPAMDYLRHAALYTTLKASGSAVGLPSEADMGNSEVGHNAIGAGRTFDQGAKLVNAAIASRALFAGDAWQKAIAQVRQKKSTLHFLGLLSDGNVHSHEEHLYAMLCEAAREQVGKIRVHILLDGRDVGSHTAETYIERLEKVLTQLRNPSCDVRIASGGGRMQVTMDRYEADWSIVERGWKAHVLGLGETYAASASCALGKLREETKLGDQFLPSFVITEGGKPVGRIEDGDSVILFNFRGDRAIEISRAFEEKEFEAFDRQRHPEVFFAGLLEYDGDLKIPKNFLVPPPLIQDTLGEYLVSQGLRQFACSETQKFGHVTYFWNGNRSGYFSKDLEEYVEIPSDRVSFQMKPWMKAYEITEATIERMEKGSFDFGRINFANGDMVGHTGDLEAAMIAVSTVDLMLRRLIQTAQKTGYRLLITADHGNCDEMLEGEARPAFTKAELFPSGKVKTSHTLAPVPCYVYDPLGFQGVSIKPAGAGSLANLANTFLDLLELPPRPLYEPSLLIRD